MPHASTSLDLFRNQSSERVCTKITSSFFLQDEGPASAASPSPKTRISSINSPCTNTFTVCVVLDIFLHTPLGSILLQKAPPVLHSQRHTDDASALPASSSPAASVTLPEPGGLPFVSLVRRILPLRAFSKLSCKVPLMTCQLHSCSISHRAETKIRIRCFAKTTRAREKSRQHKPCGTQTFCTFVSQAFRLNSIGEARDGAAASSVGGDIVSPRGFNSQ